MNIQFLNIYEKIKKFNSSFISFYIEEVDRIILTKTKSVTIKNNTNNEYSIIIKKRLPAKYWNYLYLCFNEIFRYYQFYPNIHLSEDIIDKKIILWIKIIPCLIDLEILRKFKKINKIQTFLIDKLNIKSINKLSFFYF